MPAAQGEYAKKPAAFFRRMSTRPSLDGLWPNCFERSSGVITFGADGDSFYEYLLKGYLQGGKQEPLLYAHSRLRQHIQLLIVGTLLVQVEDVQRRRGRHGEVARPQGAGGVRLATPLPLLVETLASKHGSEFGALVAG